MMDLALNVSNNGPQIIILRSTMQIMWARSHNIPTQNTGDNV